MHNSMNTLIEGLSDELEETNMVLKVKESIIKYEIIDDEDEVPPF